MLGNEVNIMWSKILEVFNPYEALMESKSNEDNKSTKHEHKEVGVIRWFFMTKWQKFLYCVPIWHSNQQRFHLGNGYCLNFETMTIDVEE